MHSWNEETYTKQSTFHVIAHLVVVQRHDLHQAFECANLDGGICVLCSLADDLHDVVPLALNTGFESQVPDICMMNYRYLAIEVVTDELKRIQQRLNSCELDLL